MNSKSQPIQFILHSLSSVTCGSLSHCRVEEVGGTLEGQPFVQILPTVLHHIISLVPVNVHSLAVADGLESKVVNPRTAVRSDILHGKCCGSCAEGRSSHSPTGRRTGWSYMASPWRMHSPLPTWMLCYSVLHRCKKSLARTCLASSPRELPCCHRTTFSVYELSCRCN